MSYRRTAPAGMIPVGFQTFSLSNSTAQGLNSTTRWGTVLDISVETQDARYRADATAPTLTTGVLLPKANIYRWEGFKYTSNLKFQRSTGTSKISIMAWRRPTDPTS